MRIVAAPPHYSVRHIGNLPGRLGKFELHQFEQLPLRKLEKAGHFSPLSALTMDDIYLHAGQPDPAGVAVEGRQLPAELTAAFKPAGVRQLLTICETTIFLPGVLSEGEIITGFISSPETINALAAANFPLPMEKTMFVSLIGEGGKVSSADELSRTIGWLLGQLIINEKAVSRFLTQAEKDAFALQYLLNLQLP
ncbi:MAG: hypothetical protein WCW67_05065 [Candidatus Margulisiibacteriota bacterium]|jgi:hypothetical protein